MGQPDDFVEVEFHIVFAAAGVFEGISLTKGIRDRLVIDAPCDAECKLRDFTRKGNAVLRQPRPREQCGLCPEGIEPTLAFLF